MHRVSVKPECVVSCKLCIDFALQENDIAVSVTAVHDNLAFNESNVPCDMWVNSFINEELTYQISPAIIGNLVLKNVAQSPSVPSDGPYRYTRGALVVAWSPLLVTYKKLTTRTAW